jgi:hypothetical protein
MYCRNFVRLHNPDDLNRQEDNASNSWEQQQQIKITFTKKLRANKIWRGDLYRVMYSGSEDKCTVYKKNG